MRVRQASQQGDSVGDTRGREGSLTSHRDTVTDTALDIKTYTACGDFVRPPPPPSFPLIVDGETENEEKERIESRPALTVTYSLLF